jgi:hypothetical protein
MHYKNSGLVECSVQFPNCGKCMQDSMPEICMEIPGLPSYFDSSAHAVAICFLPEYNDAELTDAGKSLS